MKIVLIGFMGAGKSSVAKVLSQKLNLERIEMDELVIKKSKRKSVPEIFSMDGETRFRELEIQTAKDLRGKDNIVVSPGGGVVMNKIAVDYIKENGRAFFLKTSFATVKKRLMNDKNRPLFKDKIKAKKLFDFRQSLYEEYADLSVDTDNKTVEEVVINLIKLL